MVKGKMRPPKYKLVFDEEGEGNGFNFILRLSKNEKLRITDADKQVCQWVTDLKQTLSENGSYTIEDFGTFSLLKSGKISFKSGELLLLNQEFEGMEEVELPKTVVVEEVEEPEEIEEIKKVRRVYRSKKVEKIEEITEVNRGDEIEKVEKVEEKIEQIPSETQIIEKTLVVTEKKKRSLWWLFVVVILLALALLFALFREPIYKYATTLKEKFIAYQQANVPQNTPVPDTVATPIVSPDTAVEFINPEPAEPKIEPAVEPKTTTPNKLTTTEKQPTAQITITAEHVTFQPGHFYLISGSFSTLQEAQKHINVSGFNKYKASILTQTGNNRYRVCLGVFETETDAERYKTLLNIPGWVLKE
jgi:hypothetical protein